jgi:uncharacterized protein (TIGR02246 family)
MLLPAVALTLLSLAAPAVSDTERAEITRTLVALEADWIAVYASHDFATLERLIADDFVSTLADGTLRNKRAHIETYRADFETLASVSSADVEVHVSAPDVAIVTGSYAATLREPKGAATARFRYTDTWLKRDGVWRCIATHENKLE